MENASEVQNNTNVHDEHDEFDDALETIALSCRSVIQAIYEDTQTVRELSSLHRLVTTTTAHETTNEDNTTHNHQQQLVSQNADIPIAQIVKTQLSQLDSILTQLENKTKSLATIIQQEKESIVRLKNTKEVADEQFQIVQAIIDDCLNDNDDNHEKNMNQNDQDGNWEEYQEEGRGTIRTTNRCEDGKNNNDNDQRHLHDHSNGRVPLWELLPGIDDYLYLKKKQKEEQELQEQQQKHQQQQYQHEAGYQEEGSFNSCSIQEASIMMSFHSNTGDCDDGKLEHGRNSLQQGKQHHHTLNHSYDDTYSSPSLVLKDQTNNSCFERQRNHQMMNHNQQEQKRKPTNRGSYPSSNKSTVTSIAGSTFKPNNDDYNQTIIKNHVIQLKQVSMAEFQKISKNIRGRISLSTVNSALIDIQSSVQQKYDILLYHHQNHHQQQQYYKSINRNNRYGSTSRGGRRSYRETMIIHEHHISNIESLSSSSLLFSNRTVNISNESQEHDNNIHMPYFISEQELRDDCLFFRKGESTARAILLILRSVKRIKQVVGKQSQICYVMMI